MDRDRETLPHLGIEQNQDLKACSTEYYERMGGQSLWEQLHLTEKEMPCLFLKNGEEAPRLLLRSLIMDAYLCSQRECMMLSDSAEGYLAGFVSTVSLHAVIDDLCERLKLDEETAPSLLPVICRYGNSTQLGRLLSKPVFSRDSSPEYSPYIIQREYSEAAFKRYGRSVLKYLIPSLCLSDTHEAAFWLEKNSDLDRYAAVRHCSKEEARNQGLFDFGFNIVRIFFDFFAREKLRAD